MKYVKKFETFNPYDDEPLSRVEQVFGKQTRLEKQFHDIVVNGLIGEDGKYWSTFNALKIELGEIIDEEDVLYKEMMHRIVEGESPTEVMNDIFNRVNVSTKESKRLLSKLNSLTESRFVGPEGEFKPTVEREKGKITIQYLEELCEYLYYHNDLDNEEKLKRILEMENLIKDLLKKNFGGMNYVPTWSKRLKKDMNIKESNNNEIEVKFVSKRRRDLAFNVYKTPDGRITRIEKPKHVHIRFPFEVGQILNRGVETWACNNGFYIDGKDTCPEEKVFGIRKSDIPKGHELRHLFPQKFR